jgi:predicted ferric reductase
MSIVERLSLGNARVAALPPAEPFQVAGPARSGTTSKLPQASDGRFVPRAPGPGGPPPGAIAAPPPARPASIRALVAAHPVAATWAAIGIGLLVVTLLWLATTVAPVSLGTALVKLGRLVGLYAGFLVVVLLALMARVPSLDRAVGAGALSKIHAKIGRWVVLLVVGHGLLIWWGYAVNANTSLGRQALLFLSFPFVTLATLGSVLLVAVGVYSARSVRRRVSYQSWHLLHLGTYLAIALAFGHQIVDGAHFVAIPVASWMWTSLYVGVGVLLLWYRLLVPLAKAVGQRLVVADVRAEAPGVVSIYLTGRRLSRFGGSPGQFVRLRFLTKATWWESHPYSLSAPPNAHWLRVTVKAVGDHTNALQVLRPGTKVLASGPYGAFTADRRTRPGVVLVAGGVGVTPLRALFESLPAAPGQLTLLYRVSSPAEIVFRRELDAIAAARGAQVHYLVGRRGEAGRADPLNPADISRLVPDIAHRDAYVCGPAGMTKAATSMLRTCGVPARHIHREEYAFAS